MRIRLFVDMTRIALGGIWANKLRSFLTILGNIVAVGSIVTLVSLIQGITEEVTEVILTEVGADAFLIERVGFVTSEEEAERSRSNPRITRDDFEALRRTGDSFAAVIAQGERRGEVRFGEDVLESVQIRGVTEELGQFPEFDAALGRLPTRTEVSRDRNVALLGWSTADRLFNGANPLDRTITIEGVHFRVVGVGASQGSMFGQSLDEFAVIPLGAYQRLFGRRSNLSLMVRPVDPESLDRAMDEAIVALRIARRLRPREDNNFGLFTSDSALDLYNQATSGIFSVLVGVVALALVVAGIVIMNIMLMAVSERTREIGLRKALGARRRDVMWQVLSESIVLSTLGGILGTALGATAATIIDRLAPVPAAVHMWSVFLAVATTALVGLFFGLYPAIKAASLDPIDALGRVS
jgi:putative ABC transport system permease protein